ncbi:redoxin domain-containing protein [bacterium AH-315-E10]|nr:redoxin domain-containing protein [bacterium AH-315-E10]MBN4073966.1 redoxin domain-containing protein [bacterium AH-315-E10]
MRHVKKLSFLLFIILIMTCGCKDDSKTKVVGLINGNPLPQTRFIGNTGSVIDLNSYMGKKNILLVFMRGFDGIICPYCTKQTSELINNLTAIEETGTKPFIVFPGPENKIPEFIHAVNSRINNDAESELPINLLLDVNLDAVRAMGIEHKLSKPTTLILDHKGTLVFSYIGAELTDRPSIDIILDELKKLSVK